MIARLVKQGFRVRLARAFSENSPSNRDIEAQEDSEEIYVREERKGWMWAVWRVLFWGSSAIYCYNCYQEYNEVPKDKRHLDLFPLNSAAEATVGVIGDFYRLYTQPITKKLLPNNNIHPIIPVPKTLVLNLSGTLVHTDFKFGIGAELVRRPGLARFLEQMSQLYQLVIFTDEDLMLTFKITSKLDPQNAIFAAKLCQEAMVMTKNGYIKDLSYLNRNLSNVILVDKSLDIVPFQPENAIILPPFNGTAEDNELTKLTPLLKYLASPKVKDVREQLKKLGKHPTDQFNNLLNEQKKSIESKFSFFKKK